MERVPRARAEARRGEAVMAWCVEMLGRRCRKCGHGNVVAEWAHGGPQWCCVLCTYRWPALELVTKPAAEVK